MDLRGAGAIGWLLMAVVSAACVGPSTQAPGQRDDTNRGDSAAQSRTLIMGIRYEPLDLTRKIQSLSGQENLKRPFNAGLGLAEKGGVQRPWLAESLPQLNTDSWQVFPDGRMETTYRLRSGLSWHDGRALTAEDFVFAWQVYRTPGLGVFSARPQDVMDEVLAPDPRTLVIRWSSLYPDASGLAENLDGSLEPLPRHILGPAYAELQNDPVAYRDRFLNNPYWRTEFVGAGAYRLGAWDPGVSIEGLAFDGYVFGPPKIRRFIMRVVLDENQGLASMLAGDIDFTTNLVLRFEHLEVLRREWAGTSKGVILLDAGAPYPSFVQFRPEYLQTPALMDLRVRKALAYSIQKEAIRDALYDGQGDLPHSFVPPDELPYPEVDRAITKYPFDPRRSEELMREAGFTKDASGFFLDTAGQRFTMDLRAITSPAFERTQAIMADTWQRTGFDVQPSKLPAAEQRLPEPQSAFPGVNMTGSGAMDTSLPSYVSSNIASRATNWAGRNRAGWVSPAYDRWWDLYNSTLVKPERQRQIVEMAKLVSDEVPVFFAWFSIGGVAHVAALRGPLGEVSFWNVHEWEIG